MDKIFDILDDFALRIGNLELKFGSKCERMENTVELVSEVGI